MASSREKITRIRHGSIFIRLNVSRSESARSFCKISFFLLWSSIDCILWGCQFAYQPLGRWKGGFDSFESQRAQERIELTWIRSSCVEMLARLKGQKPTSKTPCGHPRLSPPNSHSPSRPRTRTPNSDLVKLIQQQTTYPQHSASMNDHSLSHYSNPHA